MCECVCVCVSGVHFAKVCPSMVSKVVDNYGVPFVPKVH